MNPACHTLAIRYAHAFLNVFDTTLTADNFASLCRAADFFSSQKTRLALVLAPYLDNAYVIARVTRLCVDAGLPATCEHLIALLVRTRRLEILADVLVQIGEQYKMRHDILSCCITSSHELTTHEQAIIHAFLERATGHKLIEQHSVDESLIAGIRVVGDNVFWEYSVRRYLAEVGRQLIR